jgi:tetratricopeptide (TPR) repeat protein
LVLVICAIVLMGMAPAKMGPDGSPVHPARSPEAFSTGGSVSDPLPHRLKSCIVPGLDCYAVQDGTARMDLATRPIPAGFFDPDSALFDGVIELVGADADVDFSVRRLEELYLVGSLPQEGVVLAELAQLSLVGTEPIMIEGSGLWNVRVDLVDPPSQGEMAITQISEERGRSRLDLSFQPVLTFERVDDPNDVRVFDPTDYGYQQIVLSSVTSVPWRIEEDYEVCSNDSFTPGVMRIPTVAGSCCPQRCYTSDQPGVLEMCAVPPSCPECVSPLANDLCENATPIGETGYLSFDTTAALPDGDWPALFGPSIWYVYTPTFSGIAEISTCYSSYDTSLAVYDRNACDGSAQLIALNDDYEFCSTGSQVHVDVVAGQELLIQVGGFDLQYGEGGITIGHPPGPGQGPIHQRVTSCDWEDDGDVDDQDIAQFVTCSADPDPLIAERCLDTYDVNNDQLLDQEDYDWLLSEFTGPWTAIPPTLPLDPVFPLPGQRIHTPRPIMGWLPSDIPDAQYRLRIWRIPYLPMTDDEIIATLPPHMILENLTEPWAMFPDAVAPLTPGESYLWQVEAYLPGTKQEPQQGPKNKTKTAKEAAGEELQELLKELHKLDEKIKEASEDLEKNPLVEEVLTFRNLLEILDNLDGLGAEALAALEAFLSCNNEELANLDPDVVDQVLAILQGALGIIKIGNDDLSKSQKEALQKIIDKIGEVREDLEDVGEALEEIKAVVSGDIWEYLSNLLGEKFKETLKDIVKKIIAKKIGTKAAGAVVSIAIDIDNFIDALRKIKNLEDLKKARNELKLKIIEKAAEAGLDMEKPGKEEGGKYYQTFFFVQPCSEYEGASFKLTLSMECWKPTPGGDPGEGEWVACDITFTNQGRRSYEDAEGQTSIEFEESEMGEIKAGDPPSEKTRNKYYFAVKWDPNCVGPCIAYVDFEVTYPAPEGETPRKKTGKRILGVIKAK